MRVRMLVELAGSAFVLAPGDEHDFPQTEALRLVSAGYAVHVAGTLAETAVRKPAVERRSRKKT